MFCINQDINTTHRRLQQGFTSIEYWLTRWSLHISTTKSKVIDFSPKIQRPLLYITTTEGTFPQQSTIRILGMHMTATFTWTAHINIVRDKANKANYFLKFFSSRRFGIRSEQLIRIVNTTIRPIIEFGAPLLVQLPVTSLRRLNSVYHKALRIALGIPKTMPIPMLLAEAGTPPSPSA